MNRQVFEPSLVPGVTRNHINTNRVSKQHSIIYLSQGRDCTIVLFVSLSPENYPAPCCLSSDRCTTFVMQLPFSFFDFGAICSYFTIVQLKSF